MFCDVSVSLVNNGKCWLEKMNPTALLIYIMAYSSIPVSRPVSALRCFVCEDCDSTGGSDTSMFRLEECPENANVSCFRSIVNFGTHTISSRSCSGAPSISERRCSGHVVNALRTEICLCGTNGCNGIENHGMTVEDKIINDYSSGRGCVFHTERRLFVGTAILLAKWIVYDS